ncbi:MAG TPA: 2-oxoacid:acceptor oxidoreductase subunit alpha [Anaerolineales bacterium]|jgi:2-oxoglutarate ferredoxin oxidoreductase subunit alpha
MSDAVAVREQASQAEPRQPIVNDLSIVVATVNGTGSQTSNLAMIRALFRMGIPVSGKNLFPSNIQGLPTWFTIRASADGYTARRETTEVLVAMNETTFQEDLANLAPGGVCFYPMAWKQSRDRDDVTYYPMPVDQLLKELAPPRDLKDYVANMVYVGAVAQLMGIELEEIRGALDTHFGGREKPIMMNMDMVEAAANWTRENLTKDDPYLLKRDDQNQGLILVDGNTAAALGAVYGGVGFAAWYPITPASSLAEALKHYLDELRQEDGRSTYAVVQAEDELAAIGMTIGAGWGGVRAMTSTSGPGISLMSEFAGLAFFAEVPVVVWDIQRMGPSTGLPTRTSQGDLLFIRHLGHGDTENVMLLPGSVAECFEFGWRAFDIAERLQTPVFVLSDLDLGMNLWMSEHFAYPDQPMDRGKVLSDEDLERIGEFARYKDVDGDGIPYRTLPGTNHPLGAWFARGTGHDERAVYSERPDDWTANMERLFRKLDTAKDFLPQPVIDDTAASDVGLISFGSTEPAIQEARQRLADEGMAVDHLRLRAIPFQEPVHEFVRNHPRIYVVEMNTTGQLRQLLQIDMPAEATRIHSLTLNDGLPLTARWITEALQQAEGG